ncbi:hypothetical protein EDB19DRAFT_1691590 [Suillus lakei]|nr:hypothetical protein EDB19DRAFT_1691590 [Suillus lakei]
MTSSAVERLCRSVLRAIRIDSQLSMILPIAFIPDSSSRASSLTLMRLLSSVGLHWSSAPLTILIDSCLLTILLPVFEIDSSSGVSSLTSMRPSSSIGLHWSSVPLDILIDTYLSTISLTAFETDSRIRATSLILMRPMSSNQLTTKSTTNLPRCPSRTPERTALRPK